MSAVLSRFQGKHARAENGLQELTEKCPETRPLFVVFIEMTKTFVPRNLRGGGSCVLFVLQTWL